MRQILDGSLAPASPPGAAAVAVAVGEPEMRAALQAFLDTAARGELRVHLPQPLSLPVARGEGHFHLAPELFLQESGWTEFRFPTHACTLRAGEALIVPPQLRHAERVGADSRRGAPAFRNLVVFAEGRQLSCHVAREIDAGKPGIAHLQARSHAQAASIHDWLCEASRLGADIAGHGWAEIQARALVAASVAGVLRALHIDGTDTAGEPALVARLRVLIQNQLGDQGLSVHRLAEQCGRSADHVSNVFRQTSGEHLIAHINRLRMERAARLLRETRLAGKEVAWACGFTAQSYFIRIFRRHHGVTPQAWRDGLAATAARP